MDGGGCEWTEEAANGRRRLRMDGGGCELDRSRLQMGGERPQMSRVGCEYLAESASSQSQLPRRVSFLASRFSLEFEGIDKYLGSPATGLLAPPPPACSLRPGMARPAPLLGLS